MAPRRKRGPKAATASTRFFGDDPTEHVEQYVDAAQAADTRALNREQLLRALSLLETKEREVSHPTPPTRTLTPLRVHVSTRHRRLMCFSVPRLALVCRCTHRVRSCSGCCAR
jgi:hypothetical protein